MENYKKYKDAYPNKNDAQIIEALANELADKVETIKYLRKSNNCLGRIYDYIRNNESSNHLKAVNIWLLYNNSVNFPKLPPEIYPCKITLKDGSEYSAYIDTQVCGHNWTEYGNTFRIRRKGRRKWSYDEVVKWELI